MEPAPASYGRVHTEDHPAHLEVEHEFGHSSQQSSSAGPWKSIISTWRFLKNLLPLALICACSMADQPLLSINMSMVARDFGFSEAERDQKLGGNVAIAFFSTGALASLLAGRFADVMPRIRFLSGLCLLGAAANLCSAQVGAYSALLMCRAAAGAVVGGVLPTVYSLTGDLCEPQARPGAATVVVIAVGAGTAIGQALAGFVGSAHGWRVPFTILGCIMLGIACLLPFLIREPAREVFQDESADAGGLYYNHAVVRRLLGTPTVLLIYLHGAFGCVPWSVILTYWVDYMAMNVGLGVPKAVVVQSIFSLGCAPGTILGGMFGNQMYRRNKRILPLLMAATTFAGMVLLLALMALSGSSPAADRLRLVVAFCAGFLVSIAVPNARAILISTTLPNSRGVAFGLFNVMDDLGKGLGPEVVALVEQHVGRSSAIWFGIAAFAPCAMCTAMIAKSIVTDEASVKSAGNSEDLDARK